MPSGPERRAPRAALVLWCEATQSPIRLPLPRSTGHSTDLPGIAEIFLHNELSGGINGRVQPWQRRRFGDVPAYFEVPEIEGRNRLFYKYAQCFFRRPRNATLRPIT